MANHLAAAAHPVQLRVGATTICFSEEAAPPGKFAVTVTCFATRSFEFCRRGGERTEDVVGQIHPARSTTTFPVADLAALRSPAACRGTLRGMLAALPQLRSLRLAEDEWIAVVPWELVPEIVGAARRGNGFTFSFTMKVHRQVMHDERVLLMACKERLAPTPPGEKKDCRICFDGLEREPAVLLPGCEHAFHRRCISNWFNKAMTCPMCRGNVWLCALPKFLDLPSTAEPSQGTSELPDLE